MRLRLFVSCAAGTAVVALLPAPGLARSAPLQTDATGPLLALARVQPGWMKPACIRVSWSERPADALRFHVTGSTTGLAQHLHVRVERGGGGQFGDCSGFHGNRVFAGSLAQLIDVSTAPGDPLSAPVHTGTGTTTYRFSFFLSPDNAARGLSTAATFNWSADFSDTQPATSPTPSPTPSPIPETGTPGPVAATPAPAPTSLEPSPPPTPEPTGTTPLPSVDPQPERPQPEGGSTVPPAEPGPTPAPSSPGQPEPDPAPGTAAPGTGTGTGTAPSPAPPAGASTPPAGPVLSPGATPEATPSTAGTGGATQAPSTGGVSSTTAGGAPGAGSSRTTTSLPLLEPKHDRGPAATVRRLIREVREQVSRYAAPVARHAAFPSLLVVVIALWLSSQDRLDRRDPKLALAPMYADPHHHVPEHGYRSIL